MGLLRKATSVSTLGAVNYRSNGEKTARYAKQSRNELRKQTAVMQGKPAQASSGWSVAQAFAVLVLVTVLVILAVVWLVVAAVAVPVKPVRGARDSVGRSLGKLVHGVKTSL